MANLWLCAMMLVGKVCNGVILPPLLSTNIRHLQFTPDKQQASPPASFILFLVAVSFLQPVPLHVFLVQTNFISPPSLLLSCLLTSWILHHLPTSPPHYTCRRPKVAIVSHIKILDITLNDGCNSINQDFKYTTNPGDLLRERGDLNNAWLLIFSRIDQQIQLVIDEVNLTVC